MAKHTDKQAYSEWELYIQSLKRSTVIDMDESLSEQKKRIERLEANPEEWFKYYFTIYYKDPVTGKIIEPALFHKRSTKRVLSNLEWFESRVWARELAKSTRTFMEVIYLVLTGKKKNVILVSNSEENAIRLLEPYRLNFEHNQRIKNDYGRQRSHKWSEGDFKTLCGASFRAIGAGQSPRGTRNDAARPDVILIDDIDTDQDCRNPEIIAKRVDWIFGALIPTRAINVPLTIVVCGNIIAEYCCVTELMKKADHVSLVNIRTNGKSSWAEKNSEEDVDRAISLISHSAAQAEYFNNPITEGRVFKELNWGKVPPLSKMEQLIVYADPATSNKDVRTSSSKVVVLMGRYEGITYVIKSLCDNTSNANFVEWFYDMYELTRGSTVRFYIENNSLQDPFYEQVFIPLFKDIGREKGYTVPIRPDRRTKPDKFVRIEGTLEPANRLGLLILNEAEKGNPHMQRVEEQFLVVSPTYKGNIDAPDCIEGGYKILDENLALRKGKYRSQRRASRRY